MTINEIIAYLWDLAGQPSDKDPWSPDEDEASIPYDPNNILTSSFGYRYYLRELNKAQNSLANYRTSKGRPIRFSKFQTRKNIKLGLTDTESTGVEVLDSYTIKITDPPTFDPDMYIDSKIILTYNYVYSYLDGITPDTTQTYEQEFMIVYTEDVEGSGDSLYFTTQEEIISVADAMSQPSGTTVSSTITADTYFTAFKVVRDSGIGTGFSINLPTYSRNITAITSMDTGTKLNRAEAKTRLYDSNLTNGTPVQWYKSGETIYFDTYLEEPLWYIVDYQRLPIPLVTGATELDIPLEWQDVVIMLVELSTAKIMQETERATILRSQINSLIGQLRTDAEEDWIGEDTQGFYVQMEAN